MPELDINPVDFITVGTVGPKGKRQFNLQAGKNRQIITLTLEKEQARQLAHAVIELLEGIKKRRPDRPEKTVNLSEMNMDLREPIEPQFRIGQMGIGYEETLDIMILELREWIIPAEADDLSVASAEAEEAHENIQVVRFFGTREQYRALAIHAQKIVDQGRPDPKQNGYVIYYWV
jgi:uncharacterized repeat protein (TIGR03847 family)